MYSPSFQKEVFIDFNCSTVVKEDIGVKSYTSFRGTIGCCSKEMEKLLYSENMGFIDLYYNDVFGLKDFLSFYISYQEREHKSEEE